MSKYLFRGLLIGFALFAAPVVYVAAPTIRETWTATNKYLREQKRAKVEREYQKKLRYVRSLPPGEWPKVHPNVRDLPD